jgi:hypothetical protein
MNERLNRPTFRRLVLVGPRVKDPLKDRVRLDEKGRWFLLPLVSTSAKLRTMARIRQLYCDYDADLQGRR